MPKKTELATRARDQGRPLKFTYDGRVRHVMVQNTTGTGDNMRMTCLQFGGTSASARTRGAKEVWYRQMYVRKARYMQWSKKRVPQE